MRVLFIKSGRHADPVTKVTELEESRVATLVTGRKLRFLGATLPPINESTRMSEYSGPDHVVLDASAGSSLPAMAQPGFYLVVGLVPSAVAV
jgi:hypothetical protein